jgi:hypothetical protein
VFAVLCCSGLLLCIYGYHTEKMLSFGSWAVSCVLVTVGYLIFLVVDYFKEAKVS